MWRQQKDIYNVTHLQAATQYFSSVPEVYCLRMWSWNAICYHHKHARHTVTVVMYVCQHDANQHLLFDLRDTFHTERLVIEKPDHMVAEAHHVMQKGSTSKIAENLFFVVLFYIKAVITCHWIRCVFPSLTVQVPLSKAPKPYFTS